MLSAISANTALFMQKHHINSLSVSDSPDDLISGLPRPASETSKEGGILLLSAPWENTGFDATGSTWNGSRPMTIGYLTN
jgi:hypothetical protein